MNIGGIGSAGVDSPQYASRQVEQQDALGQQVDQAVTVHQAAQSQKTDTGDQPHDTAQAGASSVAGQSGQLAEKLETGDAADTDQALVNKANAGSVLTSAELSRLKEADPALYARVIKAQQAREELRNQMEQNPSGAKQAVHSAISQNNSQGQEMVRKALEDEYSSFASKYDQVELSGEGSGK